MVEFSKPQRDCEKDIPRDELIRNRKSRFLVAAWPCSTERAASESFQQNLDMRISNGSSNATQAGELGT